MTSNHPLFLQLRYSRGTDLKLTRFPTRLIILGIFLLLIVTSIGQFTAIPVAEAQQNFDGMGIQRTTTDIMNAQLLVPAERPVHIKIEHEAEDRPTLPQNPASPPVSATGAGGQPVLGPTQKVREPRLPQSTSIEFTGATLSDTGAFPPDTMGAVGSSQFLVGVNGRIRTFNKTTGLADGVINADMDVFFSSAMTPIGGTFTSDPRVRYDHFTDRWIVIIIDVPPSQTNNRILLAVSNTGVISGSTVWTFFFFQQNLVPTTGDTGCLADYPTLGVDVNALYIGTNQFCPGFSGTAGFVVQKSSILGAGPIVVTAFRNLAAGVSAGPYTPQGVDNYDPSATEGYFIGVDNANFGILSVRRVSNPGSTTPTISGNIQITVPTTTYGPNAPHSGNTQGATGFLDVIDDRLFAAVMRNGHLWTAHNIGVDSSGVAATGDRTGVRWYELSNLSGTPLLDQSGTIYDSAGSNPLYYWMPTVMVSGQGHAAFGMSASGVNIFPSAATIGRLSGDTLGTLQGTPVIYEAGAGAYNPPSDPGGPSRRWGDYSYTSLDPCDDMTMWTIQEFTNATNSYGVRAVKLLAPPPAVVPVGPIATFLIGKTSVLLTIDGTATSGRGFFDPGAGFNCRLAVNVTNSVTVNSLTYVNPTQIMLDLSTVGATTGLATVTITNPDGQQVATSLIIADFTIPPQLNFLAIDTPTLTWNRVGWATEYEIQIANNTRFAGRLVYPVGNVLSFTVPSPSPLSEGLWYWRVRARNGIRVSAWSKIQTFTIDLP